jgi:hypothetical protein
LGGESDKYGGRFEGKWTASCLADLLKGKADVICLEPPGDASEGVEFWLRRGNVTEYHQVKRQHSALGAWTIPELSRMGVLATAYERTRTPGSRFVFVSTVSIGGLEELRDLAQRGAPFALVKDEFTKGTRKDAWRQLLDAWHDYLANDVPDGTADDEERIRLAYDHLGRIEFHWFNENDLTEHIDTKMQTISRELAECTRNDLIAYALDNLMHELHGDDIWDYLVTFGHARADYGADENVIAAVATQNERYAPLLKPIESSGFIDRGEVTQAFDALLAGRGKTSVLLSGVAGVGKSSALGQLVHKIKAQGIPHLYFRLDRLDPQRLPESVGSQLGLPASPVEVLDSVAKGRPCVLIIDQLDAVSQVSGRNPEFFECIHEIIRKVAVFPEMRLAMACRRFDLEKDNRLRELVGEKGCAQEITIGLLPVEDVRSLLRRVWPRYGEATADQVELLRLPLHLSIFSELVHDGGVDGIGLSTPIALFKAYWEHKVEAVTKRLDGRKNHWTHVVDTLCEHMTRQQTLFVHEHVILDDFRDTVRIMESEGVLTLEEEKVGFFHEAFFDYCFARGFLRRGKDLRVFLKDGEQHLFKRAPLRQVLVHLHGSGEFDFVQNLSAILGDSEIRFHIKKAALEAARRLDYSSDEIWNLYSDILENADEGLRREVKGVLIDSSKWFQFLDEHAVLERWLADDADGSRWTAQRLLAENVSAFPDRTVALLKPYVGVSPEWNSAILRAIWRKGISCSRAVFDLFLELVSRDLIDEGRGERDFWMCIYGLPKEQPEWAAKAVGTYLEKKLAEADYRDISRRFLDRVQSGEHIISDIAGAAPIAYLDYILPVVLDIVEKTGEECEGKLLFDSVWRFRTYKEDAFSIEDALLVGCENAIRQLAIKEPEAFLEIVERLRPYGDYDTINFLLVRGFAVVLPSYAGLAAEYFLENPQRLECGWGASGGGDASYWAARECIEHISRKCPANVLNSLCETMVDYFPLWERSKDGYKWRGSWQLIVLSAIAPSRQIPAVKARLSEWNRKFPDRVVSPPKPMRAGFVGSPVPADAVAHMSDKQWLHTMHIYDTEEGRKRSHFLRGGAHQFSGDLEKSTKEDPERFAVLALRFTANIHSCYFDSILRGLKEATVEAHIVYNVIRYFFSLPDKPGSRWMCGPILKFSEDHIPDDILEIVGWLATESADPKDDELKMRTVNGGEKARSHDLLGSAINCVRGSAAEAIGTFLFDGGDRLPLFLPYLEQMVNDPAVVVRTTVAYALLGLYKYNEDRAVNLFIALCNIPDDDLFTTHHVDRFIYYANYRHFDRLHPLIERMLTSSKATVREAGARHSALAQFHHESAKTMVDACLAGDESLRIGIARVAEANLFHSDCVDFCHPVLSHLFNDPAKKVRDEAASAFRRAEKRQLELCRDLIRDFLQSKAFAENVEDLTWAIKSSTANLDEEIIATCEAVVCTLEEVVENPRSRLYVEADNVAELILRAYRQSHDSHFQSRCLDLIDRLLSIEAYGITKELEAFER